MKNPADVIKELIAKGATEVKDIVVRNVTITPKDGWVQVALTINKEIDSYVQNLKTGKWELGKTNVIFVSGYSVGAILKDIDEAAFAVNYIMAHPEALGVMLSRSKINIVREPVKEGTKYKNPFSDNAEEKDIDHDTFITHLSKIELSDYALKKIDAIADKMLGF